MSLQTLAQTSQEGCTLEAYNAYNHAKATLISIETRSSLLNTEALNPPSTLWAPASQTKGKVEFIANKPMVISSHRDVGNLGFRYGFHIRSMRLSLEDWREMIRINLQLQGVQPAEHSLLHGIRQDIVVITGVLRGPITEALTLELQTQKERPISPTKAFKGRRNFDLQMMEQPASSDELHTLELAARSLARQYELKAYTENGFH